MLQRVRATSPDNLNAAIARAKSTIVFMIPRIIAGLVGAGFLAELLPVDQIERLFGENAGFGGVILASLLGALTPGGPFVAFAIGASSLKAGATLAPLIAYITAWSTMNLNRSITYELPLMGRQFLLIRLAASLPLSFVLGGLLLLF